MEKRELVTEGVKMDSSDSLRIPITNSSKKRKGSNKGVHPEQKNNKNHSFNKYTTSQPALKGMKKVYRNPGR